MADSRVLRVPYSAVTYDRRVARYRLLNGRYASPQTVRAVIDADIDATKTRLEAHARQVQQVAGRVMTGEATQNDLDAAVARWRDVQAQEIKGLHLANLAMAKGGFHALESSDFGRAGQIIRQQYAYLNARAEVAANNPNYAASERFVQHAMAYGEAARGTYEAQKLVEDKAAGYEWEENELEPGAHHCAPKGAVESCEQQSDKGRVPIGTLIPIGQRVCKISCRCNIVRYKAGPANASDTLPSATATPV